MVLAGGMTAGVTIRNSCHHRNGNRSAGVYGTLLSGGVDGCQAGDLPHIIGELALVDVVGGDLEDEVGVFLSQSSE